MRISPINVSVHTTNPELRVKMMKNRFAGEVLSYLPMLAEAGNADNFHIIITTNSLPDLYYDRAAVKNCGYKILQHNVQDADGIMEASFRKEMMRNLNENLVFVSEKGIYSKCRYFQYDMEKENTKKLLSAAVKGNG